MRLEILIPIGLSALMPFLLLIGGILNVNPGMRFKGVAILTLSAWCVIAMFMFSQSGYQAIWNLLAGILCISAVILTAFMVWSVLCWGYTISMLLSLAEKKSVSNLQEWENLYAGTEGIRNLSINRSTVLVALRFALIEQNDLVLTKRGYFNAGLIQWGSQLFGVTR